MPGQYHVQYVSGVCTNLRHKNYVISTANLWKEGRDKLQASSWHNPCQVHGKPYTAVGTRLKLGRGCSCRCRRCSNAGDDIPIERHSVPVHMQVCERSISLYYERTSSSCCSCCKKRPPTQRAPHRCSQKLRWCRYMLLQANRRAD